MQNENGRLKENDKMEDYRLVYDEVFSVTCDWEVTGHITLPVTYILHLNVDLPPSSENLSSKSGGLSVHTKIYPMPTLLSPMTGVCWMSHCICDC